MVGNIELTREHTVLVIPNHFTVYPQVHGRLYPGEMDKYLSVIPCSGDFEVFFIDPGRVVIRGHEWRFRFKRVFYISKYRWIVLSVALQLPVTRDPDIVPVRYIIPQVNIWQDESRILKVPELPIPVKYLYQGRVLKCIVLPVQLFERDVT